MIIVLLVIAVALLCVSFFLLLVWMPKEEAPIRETVPLDTFVDTRSLPPEKSVTASETPVSQTREPELPPLGTDLNMEFPTLDTEIPPQ